MRVVGVGRVNSFWSFRFQRVSGFCGCVGVWVGFTAVATSARFRVSALGEGRV